MQLFDKTNFNCSKLVTRAYSTSFSLGIYMLAKRLHAPIYAIYGLVRYADEIVDTFHGFDKADLLARFKADTYQAIREGISLNPILHSFQLVVNQYKIDLELIEAFFRSMEMDLHQVSHTDKTYSEYIYGSAEVVGLMCLKVFVEGDQAAYEKLKDSARRLGAAFQKVNFLRDVQADYEERGRVYFPEVNFARFSPCCKAKIELDIIADFEAAYQGIKQLPRSARLGVYVAYVYYLQLFKKIQTLPASKILQERIRISDKKKMSLLLKSYFKVKFGVA